MTPEEGIRRARALRTAWEENNRRVWRYEKYRTTRQKAPTPPDSASDDYKGLAERSPSPWADRIVTAVSDQLYVDGFFRGNSDEGDGLDGFAWDLWQANGLDATQTVVHDDALAFGKTYAAVLPGQDGEIVKPWGLRNTLAVYQKWSDEYPLVALHREVEYDDAGRELVAWTLLDDEAEYRFPATRGQWVWNEPKVVTHGAGRTPLVAFYNRRDAYGNFWGEIELVERVINRLDQDTFDRLVVQRLGSWKVRWATGMLDPENDDSLTEAEKAAAARFIQLLQVGDVLMSESPDTKFGTLDETPLDGFIAAFEQDVETLGALADIPPSYLLAKMVEMSAEALAASEAGLARKVMKRQATFGESWEQVMRLAAHIAGDDDRAADFNVQVKWRQLEPRFLAQAADGLGKMAQMLGVPVELLWERLPGWTQQDVERAKAVLGSRPDRLAEILQSIRPDEAA